MSEQHTPIPWVIDDGMVDYEDQAGMLIDNIGTDRQWVAVGVEDGEGFAQVVALTHPTNAPFICKAVNLHDKLVDAVKKCEDVIGMARLQGKLSNSGLSPVNDALVAARTVLDLVRS